MTTRYCVVIGHHPSELPGGAELQSHLIAKILASRSFDCHYVAYESSTSGITEIDGVTVHSLPSYGFLDVIDYVTEIDADVHYFRNVYDLPILLYLEKLKGKNAIYNVSHDRQCKPIFSTYGWKSEGFLENLYGRSRRGFYRSLLPAVDHVITHSYEQRIMLRENRDIHATFIGKGHTIPEELPEKEDPPVVLWIANLKQWKHPEKFIELARECTDLDCRFRMVGRPSDEKLSRFVEKKTDELPNLEYLGGCSIEESNRHIQRASVFVNTSEAEGLPNTFTQSWARKTPVVSLSVEADNALAVNDIGFPPTDFDSMVANVRTLIENPKLRRQYGENAYCYARNNHDIDTIGERMVRYMADEFGIRPD